MSGAHFSITIIHHAANFDLYEVMAYVFLWTTLYFVLCLYNVTRNYEWHCRTVTFIHATTITALACYCVFIQGPSPFTSAGGPNTPFQARTVSLCLAYFLFDFTWCIYFRTEGLVMLTHHFLSIVGLSWCLVSGYYGTELVATIAGAEITNPLLQLRWFMRKTGYYKTIWGDIVDWAFMLSFGCVRIFLGSVLLYCYYQQDTDFWGRLGGTCIYGISWIFFISIINYAIHKYVKRYQGWMKTYSTTTVDSHLSGTFRNGIGKANVGIIKNHGILSQQEIKDGNQELTLRKNCHTTNPGKIESNPVHCKCNCSGVVCS